MGFNDSIVTVELNVKMLIGQSLQGLMGDELQLNWSSHQFKSAIKLKVYQEISTFVCEVKRKLTELKNGLLA